MNLVTGLWGMNVNVPGQFADGLGWFFGVSLSCSFFIFPTRSVTRSLATSPSLDVLS